MSRITIIYRASYCISYRTENKLFIFILLIHNTSETSQSFVLWGEGWGGGTDKTQGQRKDGQ
jgi:hypothetical protein